MMADMPGTRVPTDSPGQVVVLGTDPHVINACAERGLSGVVIRDVGGHLRGDNAVPDGFTEVVVGDLTDIGDVLGGLLRASGGAPRVDAVVTMNEFAVATAAGLAEVVGARSIPLAVAVRMRDKHAQKEAVRAAGLPTAGSRYCVPGSADRAVAFPGPCVVKPLTGAGTELTFKCRTEQEYDAALRSARRAATPLVVEDLVDVAEEWMYDGVVAGGEVVFGAVGRYAEPVLDTIGSGHTGEGNRVVRTFRVDDVHDPEACAEARTLAQAALAALGYDDGAFHLELLRERGTGRFLFGECAGRRGGAMIEEEVLAKFGYSIAGGTIDAFLGREPRRPTRHDPDWFGSTYMHLPAGTLVDVAGPEDLLELDFVHAVHISALIGPLRAPEAMHSAYRQAMAVVSGRTREELEDNMEAARRRFAERSVVAPTDGTRAELRRFTEERRRERAARG